VIERVQRGESRVPIISIRLEDTDIRSALRAFAEILGRNIAAHRSVHGRVRALYLIDVPADQAFDLLLRTEKLQAVSEGGVLVVYPLGELLAVSSHRSEKSRAKRKRIEPQGRSG